MKRFFLLSLLLFLNSCSCSKEEKPEELTFDKAWEQYHLLCNFNIANEKRCAELADRLNDFDPVHVSEETLQKLVKECTDKQPSACVVLSWYFVATKKYEGAVKFGKDFCPQNPVACYYVGEAYSNLNQLSEALPYLEDACKGDEAAGCERIGHFYLGEKKPDGAIKYFRKACDLEESFGCYNLACVYSLKEEASIAYNALEEALQLGFEDWNTIATDKDLNFLRSQKDIPGLIEQYKD